MSIIDVKHYEEETVTIKIKYHDSELIPLEHINGKRNSGWIDLRASQDTVIPEGSYGAIPLGISMQLPEGYEAIVAPRSSLFKNYGLIQVNGIGVIDNGYCGDNDEWMLLVYCLKGNNVIMDDQKCTAVHKNDRVAQFRIQKVQPNIVFESVYSLDNPDRGGVGSSGVE